MLDFFPTPFPTPPTPSPIACDCTCSHIQVVWCLYPVGDPVFAVHRTPTGRWVIVAPVCRDLSGRTGVRRIAAFDEPAAGEPRRAFLRGARAVGSIRLRLST